ncbi:MAG: GTP-binding protein [Candidatus Lokiarchaeota archaeon]|nr:GTP-binding protein [Candidatus Lokiarchaeota archaeon]MBD3199822.1 GTP-binding protein [Candidatus Lokiarchaeota archaeon]
MGVRDILQRIFTKDKKIVLCGLDNAGKTTMVTFLEKGTFVDHTPTMGKETTEIEVQGIRINIADMGGQKDFRSLWLGEMKDAECVIFMVDASDSERFDEARGELMKLSSIIKEKPLIVLANKCDKGNIASLGEIIAALNLQKCPSFEIFPISCKTGAGIVEAFMKIYYKLTGKQLTKKISPKALTVFDKGGVPLTSTSNEDVLQGGLFAAITSFVRESFKTELSQLRLEGNIIIFKRSRHLMGSIVIDDSGNVNIDDAESGLDELLCHLENMCPELEKEELNTEKIEYLVKQYSSNLLN